MISISNIPPFSPHHMPSCSRHREHGGEQNPNSLAGKPDEKTKLVETWQERAMNQGSELSRQGPVSKGLWAPRVPGTVPGMGGSLPAGPVPVLSELTVARGPGRRQRCIPHWLCSALLPGESKRPQMCPSGLLSVAILSPRNHLK